MATAPLSGLLKAAGFVLLFATLSAGQQVNDTEFRFENPDPAFPSLDGPRVCMDETHHNRHTLHGLFAPFAKILRDDGFRTLPLVSAISRESLQGCDILILGNPQSRKLEDPAFWTYPHPSAFSKREIDDLLLWVRGGGALLVFADHAPGSGSSAALAAVFGMQVFDGWARINAQDDNPEMYRRSAGLFANHPILRGRSPRERIDHLAVTIAGAFFPSEQFDLLIRFGPEAVGYVRLGEMGQGLHQIPEGEWPRFQLNGWWLGGARQVGTGRVVIFGDVTACTAQFYGSDRAPVGMNHPEATQNAQFCLNLVRWLGRVL